MLKTDIPLVSIIVLTYCQVGFIEQTIESLLRQHTEFNFKILVCDDGSTDGTNQLLETLYKENDQVYLVLRKKNIGMMNNFIDALNRCDTKYIAFCDGDDYWIDQSKLSKQVKVLEEQSNVDITATRAMIKYPNSDILSDNKNESTNKYYTFSELLMGNKIVASSVLLRNYQVVLPQWVQESIFGDWPFYLLSIQTDSLIHLSKDYSVVYRKDVGVTKNNSSRRAHFLKGTNFIYENLLKESKFINYKHEIKEAIFNNNFYLMGVLNQTRKYLEAFKIFIKIVGKNEFRAVLKVVKRYLKTLINH